MLVAECGWPVEARFLAACVDDARPAVRSGKALADKLQASRPRSIGQAARLDGITPAALTLLVAHLKRRRHGSRTAGAAGSQP